MKIIIRTLTPLWTGGVERGKRDRIHETGLLGSLRWWMEVLVRGMGGQVKDPTADERSGLDPKKFDAKVYRELQDEAERRQYLRNAGLCDVSQIFGATGWKRQFRLEIQEVQVADATIQHSIKANRTYTDSKGNSKIPTWYFQDAKPQNAPKIGTFILKIQSLHPDLKPEVIGGLIQFIADWSALGARPQMGFGVIKVMGVAINGESILKNERIPTQSLYDWLQNTEGKHKYPKLPSLQNIFLATIQPKTSNPPFKEQDTFNLKYDLRQLFRTEGDAAQQQSQGNKPILKKEKGSSEDKRKHEEELRHFIMGAAPDNKDKKKDDETEDKRMAAKVKISRPYDENGTTVMRVWGWIPEEATVRLKDSHEKDLYTNGWNREKVIDTIYQYLNTKYTLQVWHKMNSERDTVTANQTDVQAFLRSLLQLQEDE